jgi:hypothetical protein
MEMKKGAYPSGLQAQFKSEVAEVVRDEFNDRHARPTVAEPKS